MSAAPVVSIETAVERRGLPSSLEAEQFVLGSVLLDHHGETIFPQVTTKLSASDFYVEKHRRIFLRMVDLHARRERIEYLTLVEELDTHGQLESIGGVAYIAALTDGLPRLDSIESYLRIVKEKSRLRELITTCHGIASRALDAGEQPAQLIADAQARFLEMGAGPVSGAAVTPRQIAEQFEGGVNALLDPSKANKGLATGFNRFDGMTGGLHPGELIVLAARPAMGKTAIALNIAANVARRRPVAVFSLEMSREALMGRLLCGEAHIDSHRYRDGYLGQDERRRLSAALTCLSNLRLLIDDTATINALEIAVRCRRIQLEHGLGLVVVDYLQLLSPSGCAENRVQEMTAASRGLKLLARDLDVPVIALSQLSRAPEMRGGDHRPQLSDLRDSGSIEQDADLVGFIFREEVYKPDPFYVHPVLFHDRLRDAGEPLGVRHLRRLLQRAVDEERPRIREVPLALLLHFKLFLVEFHEANKSFLSYSLLSVIELQP